MLHSQVRAKYTEVFTFPCS